jgi:hypothetical protein
MTDLNKLAFNIATRMKEIDAYETGDHNRYACLWDAVLDEFGAAGISLHKKIYPEDGKVSP